MANIQRNLSLQLKIRTSHTRKRSRSAFYNDYIHILDWIGLGKTESGYTTKYDTIEPRFFHATVVHLCSQILRYIFRKNSSQAHFWVLKMCACNVIMLVTRKSRYKHRCACDEGISKFCSLFEFVNFVGHVAEKNSPRSIVLFANWSVHTCNGTIFPLSCYLASSTHTRVMRRCYEYTRTCHPAKEHFDMCLPHVI